MVYIHTYMGGVGVRMCVCVCVCVGGNGREEVGMGLVVVVGSYVWFLSIFIYLQSLGGA